MSIKSIQKLTSARALFKLESHETRRKACRARKLAAKVKWCENMAIMRQINEELAPKIKAIQIAEERLSGVKNVHSNAFGKANCYCTLTYCGGVHTPSNVNDNGMSENEPLWTTGQALKEREEVRE